MTYSVVNWDAKLGKSWRFETLAEAEAFAAEERLWIGGHVVIHQVADPTVERLIERGFEPEFAAQVVRHPQLRNRFLAYRSPPKVRQPWDWQMMGLCIVAAFTGPIGWVIAFLWSIDRTLNEKL